MRSAGHLVSFLLASFVLSLPVLSMADGPDECKRGTAASVNLPEFLNVDLKAMKVHSGDSPIRNIEHLSGNLIIQDGSGRTRVDPDDFRADGEDVCDDLC